MALYADPERTISCLGKLRSPQLSPWLWDTLCHCHRLSIQHVLKLHTDNSRLQGDFSERIEALSDAEVQTEVLGVLGAMYPDVNIPAPLDFLFYRWNADPLYRGTYSNWPPSFVTEHHRNLRAKVNRLFFAGEATSKRSFGQQP